MKVSDQYFPVVLFIMLYHVVPTFECVDEILKYSNLSLGQYFAVYCAILNFESVDEILKKSDSYESVGQ